MPAPKIISFYTQDWQYPQHAQRLAQECDALGLEHRIECLPSTGSYIGNTCMKSTYVLRCLESETGPLLWVDVDGSVLTYPHELVDLQGADIAARRRRAVNEYGYTWHVGTLWFSGNDASRDFARAWSQHPTGTDENKFDQAWRGRQHTLKIWELPAHYFVILSHANRHAVPAGTVVAHRISNSDMKRQEKAQSRAIRAARRRAAQS